MDQELLHGEITRRVIGCYYDVYNALGYGFAEIVYHRALVMELRAAGLQVDPEAPIEIHYRGAQVGRFRADLVVEERVLVELKAVEALNAEHRAQLVNYLKSTRYEVGLLLNFGPRPTYVRRIFTNSGKGSLDWAHKPPDCH